MASIHICRAAEAQLEGEWEPGLEVGEPWLVGQPSDPEASRAKAMEGESDSPSSKTFM